jgi:hypothetical protein
MAGPGDQPQQISGPWRVGTEFGREIMCRGAVRGQAEANRELKLRRGRENLEDLGKLADIIERETPAAMDGERLGDLLARLHRIVVMQPRSRSGGRDHIHLRDRGDIEHADPGFGHSGDHRGRAIGLDGIRGLARKALSKACHGGAQGLRREAEERLARVQRADNRRGIGVNTGGSVDQGAGMDVHGMDPENAPSMVAAEVQRKGDPSLRRIG